MKDNSVNSSDNNKHKPMTLGDIIPAFVTIIFGFIMMTIPMPTSLPHQGILYIIILVVAISGPIVFLVKFFTRPIEDDLTKEKE